MNKIMKITSLAILLILLFSQIYIIYSNFPSSEYTELTQPEEETDGANVTEDQEETSSYSKLYPVLCEIGTATWCKYCPEMERKIYEIYDENKYPLYIISLVYDKNKKAKQILENNYNIYGFPTVFIDGGRYVIYGSNVKKSEIESKIRRLSEKPKRNISMDIDADLENNESIYIKLMIKNNEDTDYSGKLRIYVVEINSRWYDYDGKPYRFSLIGGIDKDVYLDFGEEKTLRFTWTADKGLRPLNKDNLMVIVVIFSEQTKIAYSDPPDNKRSFDARYVDCLHAERIGEGNLPPQIGVAVPKEGFFHLRSKPFFRTLFGRTIVIGKTRINFTIRDDGNYIKIRVYLDGRLKYVKVDNNFKGEKTYHLSLPYPMIGRHVLKIEAYDESGEKTERSMDLLCFLL